MFCECCVNRAIIVVYGHNRVAALLSPQKLSIKSQKLPKNIGITHEITRTAHVGPFLFIFQQYLLTENQLYL